MLSNNLKAKTPTLIILPHMLTYLFKSVYSSKWKKIRSKKPKI